MGDPDHDIRHSLATSLLRRGCSDEALRLCRQDVFDGGDDLDWLRDLVSSAMEDRDLAFAGECAAAFAALRWGSRWYPRGPGGAVLDPPARPPVAQLTAPKLRHDIEQFRHLQDRGILGDELAPIIAEYERAIDRLAALGPHARAALDAREQRAIGHVYNRLLHVRATPRVAQALSAAWDRVAVESSYLERPPGIAVVDDFLSQDALAELRAFCLESTVWSANRYAHGRLGAFFRDGFNCPLLLQIAEELRQALPRVIGSRYPLRQLWGFKYDAHLPADSTNHADFAAVNVNFWITPDAANLDDRCGGMVIYDVDAPLSWDFDMYNRRRDIIKPFLEQRAARAITIPYRQNRAVIFNSDLFHATAEIHWRPGYEHRRINVTMLYGNREHDIHHRAEVNGPAGGEHAPAWRSAAFSRTRGGR